MYKNVYKGQCKQVQFKGQIYKAGFLRFRLVDLLKKKKYHYFFFFYHKTLSYSKLFLTFPSLSSASQNLCFVLEEASILDTVISLSVGRHDVFHVTIFQIQFVASLIHPI